MKNKFLTINNFDVYNKTILLRVDFNSPMSQNGKILDDSRIKSHINTLNILEDSKIVLLTHQSRPGKTDFTTTKNHTLVLSNYLPNRNINYIDDLFGSYARSSIISMKKGDILVLENVRFFSEESLDRTVDEHGKSYFVTKITPYVDIFLNDAFAVSHRSHLSVIGFTKKLPSGAGIVIEKEIHNLNKVFYSSQYRTYSLGGSKVNDLIKVTKNILDKNNSNIIILLSGLVGNIALLAADYNIGSINKKLIFKLGYEKFIPIMKILLEKYPTNIFYPKDVALNNNGQRTDVSINELKKYDL